MFGTFNDPGIHARTQLLDFAIRCRGGKGEVLAVPPGSDIEVQVPMTLEADKSVELINMMNPTLAVLDSPSPNLKAYKAYVVERLLHKTVELKVEHKADLNHPTVAAASIFAKVTRDEEIAKIKARVGDFGSGYMADPKTKKFLEKAWKEHASIFRKSWTPYQKLAAAKRQKKLF